MLEEADVKRFQKLYRIRFGASLEYETAHAKLAQLIRQMETVYKPITRLQAKQYEIDDENKYERSRSAINK
jgi:uncharacterized membrane protein